MNAFLMHRDRDVDPEAPLPQNAADLMQDLELDILLSSMAAGDRLVYDISKRAVLCGLGDVASILYRQAVLDDCILNPHLPRRLYDIATEAVESKRRNWFGIHSTNPDSILHSAVRMIGMYLPLLEELRTLAEENVTRCTSEGLSRLLATLRDELSAEYIAEIRGHLQRLAFGEGVLVSACLGRGLEGCGYALRRPRRPMGNLVRRVFSSRAPVYGFSVNPRDDAGCQALGELRSRGVNLAADSLARSADHIEGFFKRLLFEVAFFVGCLNLRDALSRLGEPVCMPCPREPGSLGEEYRGLYNPCLSLHAGRRSFGNDVCAVGRNPVIITGVNEGGKSTFLRSVGVAALMMRCGMFAPAEAFSSDIATGIFTHYRRREDRSMTSGKLDEELARMDAIADRLAPGALVLFNESFAATNEREGGDIAGQITRALVERNIRVYFVTHLYSFAAGFAEYATCQPLFLRAERRGDGGRSYKIVEGVPSPRSHGEDLYRKVFEGASGCPASPP